jgi:hypothetical protein
MTFKRKFKNERTIKANKDHVCEYCLETIERGSSYCQRFKVYDKEMDGECFENPPIKVHHECKAASERFTAEDWFGVFTGKFQRPSGNT